MIVAPNILLWLYLTLLSMGFESLCVHPWLLTDSAAWCLCLMLPDLVTCSALAAVLWTLIEKQNPTRTWGMLSRASRHWSLSLFTTFWLQEAHISRNGVLQHIHIWTTHSFEAWFDALTATEITLESISSQWWWLTPVDSFILRYLCIMQMCFILQSMCQIIATYCASYRNMNV